MVRNGKCLLGWGSLLLGFLVLEAGVGVLATGGETAGNEPAVVKTIIENLPEKINFSAFAIGKKIFVLGDAGGLDRVAISGSVYAFDPSKRTWEKKRSMPVKRVNCSSVLLNDKIYVIGGEIAKDTPTDSVEVYDPATDTWTTKHAMPTARCRMGTVVLDGKIFAMGGRTKNEETDALEVYDPVTDKWSIKNRLPRKLFGVNAKVVGGRLFMLRGASLATGQWEYHFDFQEYDRATDSWSTRAAWTFEREPVDTIVVNERFFVVGGGAFTDSDVHSLKEYDVAADRWVFRSEMPAASVHTIHPSLAVLGRRFYILGGGYWEGNGWKASDRVQRYDPATNTWEILEPLSEPKIGMAVVTLGNRLFVFGGERMGAAGQESPENSFSSKLEIYEMRNEIR